MRHLLLCEQSLLVLALCSAKQLLVHWTNEIYQVGRHHTSLFLCKPSFGNGSIEGGCAVRGEQRDIFGNLLACGWSVADLAVGVSDSLYLLWSMAGIDSRIRSPDPFAPPSHQDTRTSTQDIALSSHSL